MQKKLCKTKKNNKIFGRKNPCLGILGCMYEKVLSNIQHPRICQNEKLCA